MASISLRSRAFIAIGSGIIAGASALRIGLANNTQGEFISETGRIDYAYCALVFGSWFVLVSVVTFVVAATVVTLYQFAARSGR